MAYGNVVLNDGKFIIIKWQGDVSYEDGLVHYEKWVGDHSIQVGAVILTDARKGIFHNTPEQSVALWNLWTASNRKKRVSKHAVLVSDEEFIKAKEFEKAMLDNRMDTIIFSNLTVACKWLGVDYDQTVKCLSEMDLQG